MKNPKPLADSVVSTESTPKLIPPVSEANGSNFLRKGNRAESPANNEKSMKDRTVYPTIDHLALKRVRLPLQLVPIDDNTVENEKKEKINGEKSANAKRPSFKVRPGISMNNGQWKSRSKRSNCRSDEATGKSQDCGTFDERVTTVAGTDQEVPVLKQEIKASRDKHSLGDLREEIIDGSEDFEAHPFVSVKNRDTNDSALSAEEEEEEESNLEDNETTYEIVVSHSTSLNSVEAKRTIEENDEFFETIERENRTVEKNLLESRSMSTKSGNSNDNLADETKRSNKSEFTFAKHVLHYVPISSRVKRTKKSWNTSKNRKNDVKLNNESWKSFSREDLRHSISTPTNFVHLASVTNTKLLSNVEIVGDSSRKMMKNEEKYAKLRYLGNVVSQVIENAKVAGKMVRNSRDDGTTCSEFEQRSLLNFTETRRNGGFDETSPCSTSTSSSSLSADNGKEIEKRANRAKVLALENSQGVPEVVKISENEGNDEYAEKVVEENAIIAPVCEAISKFSITAGVRPSATAPAVVPETRANASFLWGGRAPRTFDKGTTSYKINVKITPTEHETNATDYSNHDNGYDAYDDVGLSRYSTEEDLYDDVGLPSTDTKNSSTDTLFEDIDVPVDSELYDDVFPIGTNLTAVTSNPNFYSEEPSKKMNTRLVKRPSTLNLERVEVKSDENRYLSISNDYSSVEEGLDDFDGDEDDGLYDDVELPSQERVNSLYAGSSSGSQLGSLCNGKESEWEDLEEAAYYRTNVPEKNTVALKHGDSQAISSKKKAVQRWTRKVRRQKSKASRKNPTKRTSTFTVAVSLGTGSVLLVGSSATTNNIESFESSNHARLPPDSSTNDQALTAAEVGNDVAVSPRHDTQLQTRGLVQMRILGSAEDSIDTQETSCYVLEDTASDDSTYENLFSFPTNESSNGSKDEDTSANPSSFNEDVSGLRSGDNGAYPQAPSRPVPPPPRESRLTETFGKRIQMLRRTWTMTKGRVDRMRRRTNSEAETNVEEGGKDSNCEQQKISNNDVKKYYSFKKHFKKSVTGLSTFYFENDNGEERLSRNNNSSKEEVYSDCSNSSWYTNTDYWRNSVTEQSQRNNVDHYSMLDEEPLYQFYAAAAARVAFESDSECYEEVERPTPSPSTVDLAKPGHRTLWCQTPQVINSTLLQELSSDERKMQEAKFEIFTSEASYLNSLRVLVDEFLNDHELVHEVLTPSEREKLFGGVPSVLVASERLLAELETVWREDVMLKGLPEVLLNYAQRSSSAYVAYCSNQVRIDTTLKELGNKKGSKFVDTVKKIESHPACQNLSLHSFLMLPMQRVTRLPLLADAVLSKVSADNKDERTCWECVLSQLSQVVMECNEGARVAGRLAEMEALERKLEYSSKVPPIMLRDRYLVRRGPVVQMLAKADSEYKLTFGKRHHKIPLYLLLLTDYLLIAKPKSNTNEETYTVIDTCKRSLVALEKVTKDSPFAGRRHAMILSLLENYSGRHMEYILTVNNATERERWLDAISPPKPSLVGETLYETWDCPQVMVLYPYAAAQPDELTLQPGDVINVLRKMTDGWHHGEKLLGGEQGWFPGNHAKEVASEHVRAKNLRQRHRLLALSAKVLQQRAKQTSRLH